MRLSRSLDDLRAIRRRFGVTPNDVVLAACAGGLRRFAERRGEPPQRLKTMVPADVRTPTTPPARATASRSSSSSCRATSPIRSRGCEAINAVTAKRRRDGDAEAMDAAFGVIALTPPPVQRALAHAFAHPRLSNLTISSVAGPAVPRYLHGCRLREVHSAVPLSARHALSIGIVTVAGRVCFGLFADAGTLPDAAEAGEAVGEAFDELLPPRA